MPKVKGIKTEGKLKLDEKIWLIDIEAKKLDKFIQSTKRQRIESVLNLKELINLNIQKGLRKQFRGTN